MTADPADLDVEAVEVAARMIVNDSVECPLCTLGPPPDMILWLPPPPVPAFLVHSSDYSGLPFFEHFNNSPCKHSCEWRAEGVQYVEMPQQGTFFDDTWLLVLISSCVGVIFIGIILAVVLIKCKFNRSNKNSTLSTSTASSGMQTTTTTSGVAATCTTAPPHPGRHPPVTRFQTEAILYQQQQDPLQDSRLMWATLTPRGTTRHYLEDHTYEIIDSGSPSQMSTSLQQPHQYHHHHHHHPHHHHKRSYSTSPSEHTYIEPPAPSPILTRPKNDKAFDNTAFIDYEEPLSIKNEYYQLEDVLEPCDRIFSVQGLYGVRGGGGGGGGGGSGGAGTLRPRVSSPTRIEHPNLPPLNLQPHRKQPSRANSSSSSSNPHTSECTLLRSGMASSGYIPNI